MLLARDNLYTCEMDGTHTAQDDEALPSCAVLGALETLRDLWTLGILRCVFYGVRRYTAIQRELGIATNVLADRLQLLVAEGILERVPYQDRPMRYEYVPTDKGAALADVILALRDWGAAHLQIAQPLPPLEHRNCGGDVHAAASCSRCQRPVTWDEVSAREPSPAGTTSGSR